MQKEATIPVPKLRYQFTDPWYLKVLKGLGVLAALALMFLVVVTPLDLKAQAILGGMGIAVLLVLNRFNGRFVSLVLIFISIIVSSRYIHWRLSTTLGWTWSLETIMAPLLLAAETYTYVVLLFGYLQTSWPLFRKPAAMPEELGTWPTVDVFIPTYNEPLRVVRATVLAAQQMDWPSMKLRIYILDDGRRPDFKKFASAAGVGYITRPDNAHAKAGNINHALKKTHGEYVAIFDCDHVPTRSFLQMTMGWFFRDRKLAMVQAPHHFYSPDPFERNLGTFRKVPNEGELFYGLIQPGNDLWNSVFFCGSCAVLKRTALLDVGGVAVETVTEDAHTALKMHRKGYTTAYLWLPQASGLATESLSAHIGQRIRWARGMAQIFRTDNPLLGRGLSFAQRICYANAMLYFFSALPRIIFLIAPLSFLFFQTHIFNATPLMVVVYALPHLVHAMTTNARTYGRYRHSFWGEVYEVVLSFYTVVPTTVALLAPKRGTFNVTTKGGNVKERYFDGRIALPYLLLFGLNLAGFGIGLWQVIAGHPRTDAFLINMFWASFNLIVLGAALSVAWEKRQVRDANRVDVKLPAMLRTESEKTFACTTTDLSLHGARVDLAAEHGMKLGEPVSISLFLKGREYPLAARMIGTDSAGLRVKFETLTIEEESWLVRALFSRWDAWTDWRFEHDQDRITRALFQVIAHGVIGIARTATLPFRFRRRASEEIS
jgi:cellulose synthase (UDP-forming)